MAVDMLDEKDTLIVVTVDHAHSMTMAGYPDRGSDILGLADESSDHLKYATLSYANGPSVQLNGTGNPRDISNDNFTSPTYRYPALVPLKDESHGGEDVAVYARGPWAHLFTGNYEQTLIPLTMAYAAQLEPSSLGDVHNSTAATLSNPSVIGVLLIALLYLLHTCS